MISTDEQDTIFNAPTDHNGFFRLDSIPEGDYRMRASCEDYISVATKSFRLDKNLEGNDFYLQQDEEALKTRNLEEVEVIAQALQSYADRDEMYLSSYNRKYGVNALDAISSLPKFIPSINGGNLLNNSMEEVSILIDGRKASADELRNLSGNDIAKVIYYQDAPAKYRGLYGGAVANIIVKKPKELKINGKLDAAASLNCPSTNDGVGLTMMTASGILNANYKFGYKNITGVKESTIYDYGDLTDSFSAKSSRFEEKTNSAQISYQLEKGRNMFFASFSYKGSDAHNNMEYSLLEKSGNSSVNGLRTVTSHPFSDSYSLNLYYSRQLNGGAELMADIVGTIVANNAGSILSQSVGDGSAYDDYFVDSDTDADMKSLIANLSFSTPLWGGSASASIREQYRYLHQDYINNFFPNLPSVNISHENNFLVALDYTRRFGRLDASLNCMLIDNMLKTPDGETHNEFYVYPRLNLNYKASSNVNIHLRGWTEGTRAGIGQQNLNRKFIDTRYFSENIEYRVPTHRYNINLSADFNIPSARLTISPNLTYCRERNGYVNYVEEENGVFISRPTLIPSTDWLTYMLYAIWFPLENLQIRPYLIGDYMAYSTPSGPVRFHAAKFRLLTGYTLGQFQFGAFITSPSRGIDGITKIYKGWDINLNAYWQHRNFFAGIDFCYAGEASWSRLDIPGFSYYTETIQTAMRNYVCISLGYTFSIGKYESRQNRRKKLNNSETDTGL